MSKKCPGLMKYQAKFSKSVLVLLSNHFVTFLISLWNAPLSQHYGNAPQSFLYQKCSPPCIEKLRPISLLPILSKLLEKCVLSKYGPLLYPALRSDQHGYRPNSSTTTCLVKLTELISESLDDKSTTATSIICFDFEKAFDSINHNMLLEKLQPILPNNLCKWIMSYLSQRSQVVKLKDQTSSPISVPSGVPQGGILSPILFNIYINDATANEDNHIFKYADDTSMVIVHKTGDVVAEIDQAISHMQSWSKKNMLKLNVAKTQIMTLAKSKFIPLHPNHSKSIKLLGVTINEQLKWDDQVQDIISKCSKRIYILKRLRPILTKNELKILYTSLIQSLILYACECFPNSPQVLRIKLTRLTKRCHRIICHPDCHCDLLPDPNQSRRKMCVKLYSKAALSQTHPLHCLIPPRLPISKKFRQPPAHTERRKNSFVPFTTELINNLSYS